MQVVNEPPVLVVDPLLLSVSLSLVGCGKVYPVLLAIAWVEFDIAARRTNINICQSCVQGLVGVVDFVKLLL